MRNAKANAKAKAKARDGRARRDEGERQRATKDQPDMAGVAGSGERCETTAENERWPRQGERGSRHGRDRHGKESFIRWKIDNSKETRREQDAKERRVQREKSYYYYYR